MTDNGLLVTDQGRRRPGLAAPPAEQQPLCCTTWAAQPGTGIVAEGGAWHCIESIQQDFYFQFGIGSRSDGSQGQLRNACIVSIRSCLRR
jgi:hypothetical protein